MESTNELTGDFTSRDGFNERVKSVKASPHLLSEFAQKYLEYLVPMIPTSNNHIDFIQAAIVLQTLTALYANKVDHLEERIRSALTVISNESTEEYNGENDDDYQEGRRGRSRRRRNADRVANRQTTEAFENLCTSKNNIRRNFIRAWSDKDIKEVDPYSMGNQQNQCPEKHNDADHANYNCYIYDNKMEEVGRKDEFRVNGFLCYDLIPKNNFCLPSCSHVQDFQACNETMGAFTFPVERRPFVEPNMPIPAPIGNTDGYDHVNVIEELGNLTESSADHQPVRFERTNEARENIVDIVDVIARLWTPIDDDSKMLIRNLRKRNVLKYPAELIKDPNDRRKYQAPIPGEYVLADFEMEELKFDKNFPLQPLFAKGFAAEHRFRIKEQNKRKPKQTNARILAHPENDVDDFEDLAVFSNVDGGNDNAYEHGVNMDVDFDNDAAAINNEGPINEAFQQIQENDEFFDDITADMSSWFDDIISHLEREETRPPFDIHEYGSKILDQFPRTNAKTTIDFANVVQNQPRKEIPRFFLASLLLANSMNVEISTDGDEAAPYCDMKLTLLHRVRRHKKLDEDLRNELGKRKRK